MLQTGIVKEVYNYHYQIRKSRFKGSLGYDDACLNTADVEIVRSSACGSSCASCGLCPGQKALVSAINEIGAVAGDTVMIEMEDKKILGASFLVYIVPLIMLIIGYFAGSALFKSETFGILTGFMAMAVTFVVIALIDKKIKSRYTPHIVRIVGSSGAWL